MWWHGSEGNSNSMWLIHVCEFLLSLRPAHLKACESLKSIRTQYTCIIKRLYCGIKRAKLGQVGSLTPGPLPLYQLQLFKEEKGKRVQKSRIINGKHCISVPSDQYFIYGDKKTDLGLLRCMLRITEQAVNSPGLQANWIQSNSCSLKARQHNRNFAPSWKAEASLHGRDTLTFTHDPKDFKFIHHITNVGVLHEVERIVKWSARSSGTGCPATGQHEGATSCWLLRAGRQL